VKGGEGQGRQGRGRDRRGEDPITHIPGSAADKMLMIRVDKYV